MAQTSEIVSDLMQEIREQKNIAQQAKYRRSHCGKSGPVRLPSDNLTHKQWEAKNGECKTYRMNEPMTWAQFMEMPDDLKVLYIKAIRKKYQTPDIALAMAFDVYDAVMVAEMRKAGIPLGHTDKSVSTGYSEWLVSEQRAEFEKWWYKKTGTYGGNLEIEGNVEDELKKLLEIVKGRNVRLSLSWEVVEG